MNTACSPLDNGWNAVGWLENDRHHNTILQNPPEDRGQSVHSINVQCPVQWSTMNRG